MSTDLFLVDNFPLLPPGVMLPDTTCFANQLGDALKLR